MEKNLMLSVITPVFNSEEYIEQYLKHCIQFQHRWPDKVEFILINDGSTDNSVKIIENYSKKYRFIKFYSYEKNQGVGHARNVGIRLASGKYLTFVDSDDSFEINTFDKVLSDMEQDTDIVYTDYFENKFISIRNDNKYKVMKIIFRAQGESTSGVNSKFYKRSFIENNQLLFPEDIVISEDAFFALDAIDKADSLLLTRDRFYILQESHTLFYFNDKLWNSCLNLANCRNRLFKDVSDKDGKDVKDKLAIDIMIPLIDRYFGPLYKLKKITLKQISEKFKEMNSLIDFSDACKNSLWVGKFDLKYRIFCKMLSKKMYKIIIIFNNLMDNIKGYKRFK